MALSNLPNHNPYAAYKQTAFETATPERLLIMLFDGGIKFLRLGEQALNSKDYTVANQSLVRVQNILIQLRTTLDIEKGGQIAINLQQLYDFYLNQVIIANVRKDAGLILPVIEFLETFRQTWIEAAKLARLGA